MVLAVPPQLQFLRGRLSVVGDGVDDMEKDFNLFKVADCLERPS